MKIKSIVRSETDLMFVSFKTEPAMNEDLLIEVNKKLKHSKDTKLKEVILRTGFLAIPTDHVKSTVIELLEKILTHAEGSLSEKKKHKALMLSKYQEKVAKKLGLKLE